MRIFVAGCFVLAFLAPAAARASSIFVFTTDTSSLSGSGYIDLQYTANAGAGASTATITNFLTNGSLGGAATISLVGDASGDLASTVTILNGALNSSGYNDYNQAISFGTFLTFQVALFDPVGGTANSTFALSYYASDDSTPVLSTDLKGASATLTIYPNGSVLVQTYPAASGSYDTTLGSVPEPASALTLLGGLVLLAGCTAPARFRRRRSQAVVESKENPRGSKRLSR
jgi:hypothetical protein